MREPAPVGAPVARRPRDAAELYLDLLKKVLTRTVAPERYRPFTPEPGRAGRLGAVVWEAARRLLSRRGLEVVSSRPVDLAVRSVGRDWPPEAETMIGLERLDNLHRCVRAVLDDGVEGDLMETGVWRGGACIFMRAALEAYGDTDRLVWAADSFAGLPRPDAARYPLDEGVVLWTKAELAVTLDEVESNFERYGLLDERVRFVVGLFRDTLPAAPVEKLAVLRLDGDMYESTMDALANLYDKLSPGGFLIVDDYGVAPMCRAAVCDFRAERGISDAIVETDWTEVWWRKSG